MSGLVTPAHPEPVERPFIPRLSKGAHPELVEGPHETSGLSWMIPIRKALVCHSYSWVHSLTEYLIPLMTIQSSGRYNDSLNRTGRKGKNNA